jgi:hypothetical protein
MSTRVKVNHRQAEAERRANYVCDCGKATCGVGKNKGQMTQAFLAWAGDDAASRAVDRRVRAMVPMYLGHQGR